MRMLCNFNYNKKNVNDFVRMRKRTKTDENVYEYFSPYIINFQLKVCTSVTLMIFIEICKYYKHKYRPYSINELPTAQRNFFLLSCACEASLSCDVKSVFRRNSKNKRKETNIQFAHVTWS